VKYDLKAAVLLVAWLIGIVYSTIPFFWFMVHPFADFWRRQRSTFRILLPLWILLWIVIGVVTWPWHATQLYLAPWSWIVAAAFFLAGFSVYRRIRSNLGTDILLGLAELRPQEHEQKLVTTGMYARTRHPIYLAHFCMLLAWTVGSGLVVNYCLMVSTVITGTVMIILEERELEKRFGQQFLEYRKNTHLI
jgi:protein-S-isoprenylcysteine O-methyltransferase Ste14